MSKLLVVVDMQNDFVHAEGALSTQEARDIIPAVVDKVRGALENGNDVIFTRDDHDENYMNTQEGQKLPVPHCINGTWGHELIDELVDFAAIEGVKTYFKATFGYHDWIWEDLSPYDEIELIGVCTDICVISNAMLIKAAVPNTPITIDARACAGVTPESHETALKAMEACQMTVIR